MDLLYPKTHGIFLHCFVSGLDRPIGSWLPLGHQQSAGQEKLGKDGRHSHGYLSVDNLHSASGAPATDLAAPSQFFCLDAAYIVLAEKLGAALVTRDARLASAPGHSAAVELL